MKKTVLVSVLVLLLAAAAAWYGGFLVLPGASMDAPANAILVITPYQYSNTWVFDDPEVEGTWTVEVRTARGRLLGSGSFTCDESP